jgi:membrane-anchored protein YejM (alkaline phosphatase superfamily)
MSHIPIAKILMQNQLYDAYTQHKRNEAMQEIDRIVQEIEERNERVTKLKDTVVQVLGQRLKEVNDKSTSTEGDI